MKTSKYIAIGLFFTLGSGVSLHAQDTIINRNVSVEREYRPVIQDAGKINSVPKVLEPTVEKATAKFSDFNLPLDAGFNIHKLSAAELANKKEINKQGYARVGIGSFKNTLLDFAYPVINQSDMRLDFSVNHLGTFESKRRHTATKTALSFDKLFSTFNLYAGLGGGRERFKYYGDNFDGSGPVDLSKLVAPYGSYDWNEVSRAGVNATPRSFKLDSLAGFPNSETLWRFNAFVGVSSLPMTTDLRYQAEIKYNRFSATNGLQENIVHTLAKFNSAIDDNRMGLDFDLYNMLYGSSKIPAFNFWKNYSVLTVNPYYSIERTDWNVRLGVKTSLSFVHGKLANPSPDVRGEWNAIPKYLSLYGALTGDYEVNTLNKTYSENPYVFSDLRVNDTYTPYQFVMGVKVKPLYNLLLDGFIDMRQIDNQYFYVNKEYDLANNPSYNMSGPASYLYTNRFNVIYSSATLVKMGVRANYNLQNFLNVEVKYAVNNWSVDNQTHAWNKPKDEMQVNANVRVNPSFSVSANMYYEGGRYAKLGTAAVKMNDKVDLNLGVSYNYLNWFTAFAKINNVLNKHYQDYYGYDVQGANVMVGAAFSF